MTKEQLGSDQMMKFERNLTVGKFRIDGHGKICNGGHKHSTWKQQLGMPMKKSFYKYIFSLKSMNSTKRSLPIYLLQI